MAGPVGSADPPKQLVRQPCVRAKSHTLEIVLVCGLGQMSGRTHGYHAHEASDSVHKTVRKSNTPVCSCLSGLWLVIVLLY